MEKIKILDAYSFLNDLLTLAQNNKPWPISAGYIIGGRFSGKTFDVGDFGNELCNSLRYDVNEFVNASVIVYRKERLDRDETYFQYQKFLNATILEQGVKPNETYKRWVYNNGNEFRFEYTKRKTKGKKYGKGQASISGDYIVAILEEAGEFEPQEITAILEALRGDNPNAQILVFYIANPENPRNWFVQKCEKLLHFNPEIMADTGIQWKIVNEQDEFGVEKKTLILYTNWRAIQKYEKIYYPGGKWRYIAKEPIYVSQDKLDWLVRQYEIDKINAMVADLGCPGADFTAIYLRDMNNLHPAEYYIHEYVRGGVDVGLGTVDKSGKTVAVFGAYDLNGNLDIYGEYVWDNKFIYKNPEQIAKEIVTFYEQQIGEYFHHTGVVFSPENPVYINVDFSDKSFIRILNTETENRGIDYFGFVECVKWEVNDRIYITQYLMQQQRLNINPCCKNLLDEMSMAQWNETGSKPKRKDDNDHSLNAFEYLMQDFMYNSISAFDKEYMYNKMSPRGKKRII